MEELVRAKCIVCGCKNKIHTQLVHPTTNEFVGYIVKCCACGDTHTFFNEHKTNGTQAMPEYKCYEQRCLRSSFCPHEDCELYDTDKPVLLPKQPTKKPYVENHNHVYVGKVIYGLEKAPKFL